MNNDTLIDILKHTGKAKLDDFIQEYAQGDATFKNAFIEKFSPKPKSDNPKKTPREDYMNIILNAFNSSTFSRPRNRYRGYYEDYGFDAEEVREILESLLEKARFYIRHENLNEAILIAQKLIEIIPDEWDANFDYEGDVQVMYDEAIDLLEEMLTENMLSNEQKESLFKWYEKESVNNKHEYVGLNTDLGVLEKHFTTGVEGGFERVLRMIEQRITNPNEYEKQQAVLEKIHLLEKHHHDEEAEKTIEEYLYFPDVRKIKLSRLLNHEQYDAAIQLINKGIKIAEKKNVPGIVRSWKESLLSIYERLDNREKIIEISKEMFTSGWEQKKYYHALKKITPKEEWDKMLEWILKNIYDIGGGYFGINELKADIFVEQERWSDLLQLCRKDGVPSIMKYEKWLRPRYEKEILADYLRYVQQQATITDKEAYRSVADTLIRMKSFNGGMAIVKQLMSAYRQTYKRRPNMMKELDRVKA